MKRGDEVLLIHFALILMRMVLNFEIICKSKKVKVNKKGWMDKGWDEGIE